MHALRPHQGRGQFQNATPDCQIKKEVWHRDEAGLDGAAAGSISIQATTTLRATSHRTADILRAAPTPTIARLEMIQIGTKRDGVTSLGLHNLLAELQLGKAEMLRRCEADRCRSPRCVPPWCFGWSSPAFAGKDSSCRSDRGIPGDWDLAISVPALLDVNKGGERQVVGLKHQAVA